jgi:hypothetical protein
MRDRVLVRAALAAALVAASTSAVSARAASRWVCEAFAAAPSFAHDRTVFCAGGSGEAGGWRGPVSLYRSADGGRTWSAPMRIADTGVVDGARAVYPSPEYPTDRTLFVDLDSGGYVTTDDGRTFTRVGSDFAFNPDEATVYVEARPDGAMRRPALVSAGGTSPWGAAVYDTAVLPATRPTVSGPLIGPAKYLVPPDFATSRRAVLLGRVSDKDAGAFACDADFVCVQQLYDFGHVGAKGSRITFAAPTFPGSRDVYAQVDDDTDGKPIRIFRSRDQGRTWAAWPSVTRLLAGFPFGSEAAIAASPDNPKRLWARVEGLDFTTERTPEQQLFRSDDDGATWTRLGYAWGPAQRYHPTKSTLPWNRSAAAYNPPTVEPGGRLYVLAQHDTGRKTDFLGLYCSRDYGRHWSRDC